MESGRFSIEMDGWMPSWLALFKVDKLQSQLACSVKFPWPRNNRCDVFLIQILETRVKMAVMPISVAVGNHTRCSKKQQFKKRRHGVAGFHRLETINTVGTRSSQNMLCHSFQDGSKRVEEQLGEIEESFGHAVRTLEARVDALDTVLWTLRQKEIDHQVEGKQGRRDLRFKYDMDILDIAGHPHPTTSSKRMHREAEKVWDTYRASFTVVMTKGYLQAVEQLRERIMIQEWDQNLQRIAQANGVTQFEAYCAEHDIPISFSVIDALYDNPEDVSVIEDVHLRMRARSCIRQEEAKMKKECYDAATEESRRLAKQFSEAEFLSKVLPDPIEHGLVSSMETFLSIMAQHAPGDV